MVKKEFRFEGKSIKPTPSYCGSPSTCLASFKIPVTSVTQALRLGSSLVIVFKSKHSVQYSLHIIIYIH